MKKYIQRLENKKLHIVALDVPFPADYGGAIDMFYRLKALFNLGFEITLHVFDYGRGKQSELDKYAHVIYYTRKRSILQQLTSRPFIVQSRKNKLLLHNLLQDKAPILFEGLHTTWYLENENIAKRITMVRMHNLEHDYYSGLRKNASWIKKMFFQLESEKLKRYQSILKNCSYILAIKESDAAVLKKINPNVLILPAAIPDLSGKYGPVSRFALFHGNLSVVENVQAVNWIIQSLKPVLEASFELIVAGKNPGKKIQQICEKAEVKLVANPTEEELNNLIQNAQIHVLHTAVESGIKLKLLSSLHSSGHMLLNEKMLGDPTIAQFCTVANTAKEFKLHYLGLQNKVLTLNEYKRREAFLNTHFNTKENCKIIQEIIENSSSI